MAVRVSQLAAEALVSNPSTARLSQFAVEALVSNPATARLSQFAVEVLRAVAVAYPTSASDSATFTGTAAGHDAHVVSTSDSATFTGTAAGHAVRPASASSSATFTGIAAESASGPGIGAMSDSAKFADSASSTAYRPATYVVSASSSATFTGPAQITTGNQTTVAWLGPGHLIAVNNPAAPFGPLSGRIPRSLQPWGQHAISVSGPCYFGGIMSAGYRKTGLVCRVYWVGYPGVLGAGAKVSIAMVPASPGAFSGTPSTTLATLPALQWAASKPLAVPASNGTIMYTDVVLLVPDPSGLVAGGAFMLEISVTNPPTQGLGLMLLGIGVRNS